MTERSPPQVFNKYSFYVWAEITSLLHLEVFTLGLFFHPELRTLLLLCGESHMHNMRRFLLLVVLHIWRCSPRWAVLIGCVVFWLSTPHGFSLYQHKFHPDSFSPLFICVGFFWNFSTGCAAPLLPFVIVNDTTSVPFVATRALSQLMFCKQSGVTCSPAFTLILSNTLHKATNRFPEKPCVSISDGPGVVLVF